mgnify:FL=1
MYAQFHLSAYLIKIRENLLYEYDNKGRIVACRVFKDISSMVLRLVRVSMRGTDFIK